MEMHVALELDGETEIDARRKDDLATACSHSGIDGAIDGGRVNSFAVADSAVGVDIEEDTDAGRRSAAGTGSLAGFGGCEGDGGKGGASNAETADAEKIAALGIE